MIRLTILALLGLLLPYLSAAPGAPAAEPPLRAPLLLDCGPGREAEERRELGERRGRRRKDDLLLLPDLPYNPRRGYGHETGEGFRVWWSVVSGIWGRPEGRDLFATERRHPESYRFDLEPGEYVVALGIAELEEHRAGRRVFHVRLQGEEVARAVDPYAIAGLGQSFRLACRARVRGDEGLTVVLERAAWSPRRPFLNAVWVYPLPERKDAPVPPPGFRGFGSYGMNVLFWEHPEDTRVAGYAIERRAPGEDNYRPLTAEPTPAARWIDRDALPGKEYAYRIAAVDVDGRRGPFSREILLRPRHPRDSTLPVWAIELGDRDLEEMLSEVHEDRKTDAVFIHEGRRYSTRVRFRGASTRNAEKIGWRITFGDERPFGRRIVYLKGQPSDYTLQQEKLTCDLFSALGAPASEARYVNLFVNGRYRGVYLDVERIDRDFMERRDLSGALFRASSFQHPGDTHGDKKKSPGSQDELERLIRRVQLAERGELERVVRSELDWPAYRDYLAASTACHRSEIEADDSYYIRDFRKGWLRVPWDHNNGNFGVPPSGEETLRPFMPLFGQTLQGIGPRRRYWYLLPSRVFHQAPLRHDYLDRLEEIAEGWLLSGKIDELIEENHRRIRDEVIIDPYRWPPGRDEPFLRSPEDLRRFARRHGERLLELIEEERRRPSPGIVINELRLDREGGWVELRNRSGEEVSLAGLALGSLYAPERPWHRFGDGESLAAGEVCLVRIEKSPRREREPELHGDDDPDDRDDPDDLEAREREEREVSDAEARERREIRRRDRRRASFPGGTVALLRLERREGRVGEEDGDGTRITLLDGFFHGPQPAGRSYGRTEGGFGFLEPSPGSQNAE